jgi:hypothetical protein
VLGEQEYLNCDGDNANGCEAYVLNLPKRVTSGGIEMAVTCSEYAAATKS